MNTKTIPSDPLLDKLHLRPETRRTYTDLPLRRPVVPAAALRICQEFIGPAQFSTMRSLMRGEEGEFFAAKFCEFAARIAAMPKSYEQDGKGDAAIVSLHYFAGGQSSWWITEKDRGCPGDEAQHQAFGLADLFGDGGELGYISIVEILAAGGELDLYFTPKTLGAVRAARG